MQISPKQYRWIRIVVSIFIALVVSQSMLRNNYILPFVALALGGSCLWICRSKVKEVMADERDYMIGGKAALLTIRIFSLVVSVGVILLYLMAANNTVYMSIAFSLAIAVCGMMLLYSYIFSYYTTSSFWNNKLLILIFFLIIMILGSIRFISGEDTRICHDGQWIAHGHPDTSMPTVPCTGAQLP